MNLILPLHFEAPCYEGPFGGVAKDLTELTGFPGDVEIGTMSGTTQGLLYGSTAPQFFFEHQ